MRESSLGSIGELRKSDVEGVSVRLSGFVGGVMSDPWKMSDGQAAALDAYISLGSGKQAADRLGISIKTLSSHITRAKHKMKCKTVLLALLGWDRFRRGEQ